MSRAVISLDLSRGELWLLRRVLTKRLGALGLIDTTTDGEFAEIEALTRAIPRLIEFYEQGQTHIQLPAILLPPALDYLECPHKLLPPASMATSRIALNSLLDKLTRIANRGAFKLRVLRHIVDRVSGVQR